jgi:hypothetical protein
VPVECLDAREELAVVADRDEDLVVRADCRLQYREGSRCELVLLEERDLVLAAWLISLRRSLEGRGPLCLSDFESMGART